MITTEGREFYAKLGSTIRLGRKIAGKSQYELADHLGITFQQMQKYEKGDNRIPVDRLLKVSSYLGLPWNALFGDDQKQSKTSSGGQLVEQLAKDSAFCELASAWLGIKDKSVRDDILRVIRILSA